MDGTLPFQMKCHANADPNDFWERNLFMWGGSQPSSQHLRYLDVLGSISPQNPYIWFPAAQCVSVGFAIGGLQVAAEVATFVAAADLSITRG